MDALRGLQCEGVGRVKAYSTCLPAKVAKSTYLLGVEPATLPSFLYEKDFPIQTHLIPKVSWVLGTGEIRMRCED